MKGINRYLIPQALVAALLLGSVLPGQGVEKIKVGTGLRVHAVFALPMLAAEEKGLWKKLGLEAEWVPFSAGGAMHRAAAAGSIQLGITDVTGTIPAVALGLPVVVVSHLGVKNDFGIYVRGDSPIKRPEDLKGKKVDVTRLGGAAHAFARAVTRALGLEKEVKFMASGGIREQMAALKSGAIDSVMITFVAIAPMVVKGEVREILAVPDYLPKEWMSRIVYARKDMVGNRPEDISKVVKAILEATDFIGKNKAWAIERMKSFSLYTPEAAEAIYPRLDYSKDGHLSRPALVNVLNFLLEFGVVAREKAPKVEDLFTTRFLP